MAKTPEGYLICYDVNIARIGTQEYLGSELGVDEEVVVVNRPAEEVFKPATIASFEGKPFTNDHPYELLDVSNTSIYEKGHVQNVRISDDKTYIIADIMVKDAQTIRDIENGKRGCGLARARQNGGDAAFKRGDFFSHLIVGGIRQTRIKIARRLKVEKIGHVLRRIVLERGGRINRNLARLAALGRPSALYAQSVYFHLFPFLKIRVYYTKKSDKVLIDGIFSSGYETPNRLSVSMTSLKWLTLSHPARSP